MQTAQRRTLGHYELLRELGSGGMGVVYAARDQNADRDVALKTLRFRDPAALYRFKREFRALADVEHPNLVSLYELVSADDEWFFTMELVDGVDFLTYVRDGFGGKRRAPTDAPDALASPATAPEQLARLRKCLQQLVSGVCALHDAGLVHRDIKPSNILVTRAGRVVLLDFGLIKSSGGVGTEVSEAEVVGTAVYMAPEQAASRPVGPASDCYSVGVVLYEALTGRRPFAGAPLEILMAKQRDEPPPPRAIAPELPRDLDELCTALLRREPGDRPAGARLLARLGLARSAARSSESLTHTPVFVGRADEFARLRAAFDRVTRGEQVTVFLRGESGVGKSALARQFLAVARAERKSAVALGGRCYERESVPYKAVDGVVDALSQHLMGLDQIDAALLLPRDAVLVARLFPVLARVPAVARMPRERGEVVNPLQLRTRAFAAVRELLARLSERGPIVLFIDDFQWTDADSLALLADALHGPRAPAVMLLATVRGERGAPLPGRLQQLAAGLGAWVDLEVSELADAEARELASELLARTTGQRDTAELIARESGGHPMLIDELVRHVSDNAGAPGDLRLDDALWSRVERLDPPARRVLEVVAVAGVPLPLAIVARAVELTLADASKWTAALRVAHLARASGGRATDTVEPYHDRVREAVLARLPDGERVAYHRAIAESLQSAGAATDAPQLLVHHLEAAGFRLRAAELAAAAAARAATALAFDRAAELYKAALRLGAGGVDQTRALRLQLADALCNAGRGVEAADVLTDLAQSGDTAFRLDCKRRTAEQLLLNGHIERGMETLEHVLQEIGETFPSTPRRALASLLWNRVRLRARGLRFTVRDESEIAQRDLVRLDVFNAVALSSSNVDNIRGADFHARTLRLALQLGERGRVCRALALEAMLNGTRGGRAIDYARRVLERAKALADEAGDPALQAWVVAGRGICEHFSGREVQAIELLDEAEWIIRDHVKGGVFELNNVRIFRLLALRLLGRCRDLRAGYDQYVRDAERRSDLFVGTTITRAFNLVWLVDDDRDRALLELDRSGWVPPDDAFHVQHWYELRSRGELDLYTGDAGETRRRLAPGFEAIERSLLTRVQIVRGELLWLRGRLALAEDTPQRARALREARALRRFDRHPLAEIYAGFLEATAAAQLGDVERAAALLAAAGALADDHKLGLFAAAARRRRGELLGGDDGAALIAAADAWYEREGVRNPAAMARLYLPGFPD